MPVPILPQFFCSRPNGDLVPLIALDELPAWINLHGIPRSLSPSGTQGMTSLGTLPPRGQLYIVKPCQTNNLMPSLESHPGGNVGIQSAVVRVGTDENLPLGHRMLQSIPQQNIPQNWMAPSPQSPGNSWLAPNVVGSRKVSPPIMSYHEDV
jgi:hypothetical protein